MNAIRSRVSTHGAVQGLWTDQVDWRAIGQVWGGRASSMEFTGRIQHGGARKAGDLVAACDASCRG